MKLKRFLVLFLLAAVPLVLAGDGTIDDVRGVVVADLDGNGEPDIASASLATKSVSVFFGSR